LTVIDQKLGKQDKVFRQDPTFIARPIKT